MDSKFYKQIFCALALCLTSSSLFADADCLVLPDPQHDPVIDIKDFTLSQAVYLTLKYNQPLESAGLGQESNYWQLRNAYFGYEPQININGSASMQAGTKPSYTLAPGVSWQTLLGTSMSFNWTPNFLRNVGTGNFNAGYGTLTINQPFLAGFGVAFNSINLQTAIYQYQNTNLSYKQTIMSAMQSTIESFRSVTTAIRSLQDSKASVEHTKLLAKNTRLKLANNDPNTTPNDLVQMEQSVVTSELSYLQQRNSAEQSYETLLRNIGLPTDTKLDLDNRVFVSKAMIPDRHWAVEYAFQHNIGYLQQKIAVNQAKLQVISARNQAKWTLDFSGTADIIGNTSNRNGTQKNASLTLGIPVFNVTNHVNIVNAEIGLAQAQINLAITKRSLETNVENEVTNASFRYQQVNVARAQVILDRDTLRSAVIKQAYGQGSSFEVNQLQRTLLQDEIQLNNTELSFLNSITNLNFTLGRLMIAWDVALKF